MRIFEMWRNPVPTHAFGMPGARLLCDWWLHLMLARIDEKIPNKKVNLN